MSSGTARHCADVAEHVSGGLGASPRQPSCRSSVDKAYKDRSLRAKISVATIVQAALPNVQATLPNAVTALSAGSAGGEQRP